MVSVAAARPSDKRAVTDQLIVVFSDLPWLQHIHKSLINKTGGLPGKPGMVKAPGMKVRA